MDLPTLYLRAHVALHAANPDARCWDNPLLLEAAYQQLPAPAVDFPTWLRTLAGPKEAATAETTPPQPKADPLAGVATTPLYRGKDTAQTPAPPAEAPPA